MNLKFEKVTNKKKKIIIGISILLLITLTITLIGTFASFQDIESIRIAEGIVDYVPGDIKIVAYTLNGEATNTSFNTLYEGIGTTYGADITCKKGSTGIVNSTGQIEFTNIVLKDQCTINFRAKKWYDDEETLGYHLLMDHPYREERTATNKSFYEGNETNTVQNAKTLYTTNSTEDGSKVYYFSGKTADNWVVFGKCQETSYNCTKGNDMFWRIVRTNTDLEDGGIRLLYSGNGTLNNDGSIPSDTGYLAIGNYDYNEPGTDQAMFGWKHGETGSLASSRSNTTNSNVKNAVDTWYLKNLINMGDYISNTAIYCNDRAISTGNFNESGNRSAFYDRFYGYNLSLKCGVDRNGNLITGENGASIQDKFTVNATNSNGTTIGNGDLDYSVAILTGDEISFAGFGSNDANTYYFWISEGGNSKWGDDKPITLTYSGFWKKPDYFAYAINEDGGFVNSSAYINTNSAARPVISLKADVLWEKGDGSASNPYIIGQYYDKETSKSMLDTHNDAECPGCVFRFGTDYKCTIDGTGSNCTGNSHYPNTLNSNEYTTDYRTLNSNYFLGYVLGDDDGNGNRPILAHYACGIENNQLYCFKGCIGQDESGLTYKPNYYEKINKMNAIIPTCNATYNENDVQCNGSTVWFRVKTSGYSASRISNNTACYVNPDGTSYCTGT